MWRAVIFAVALGLPGAAHAQAETLADIRQELSVLFVEIQRLRGELNTTGAPSGSGGSGTMQSRMDAIEAELRRLTSATEELDLRVNRVVSDGSNRIGDLEFRLCELEAGCDIGTLGETSTLGGDTTQASALPPVSTRTDSTGTPTSMAAAEQSDFDSAMAAFEADDFLSAATQFEAYTETYPGGALSAEAHFWRGEAEAAQGAWNRAARAYLASFSGAPDAPRAPESLFRLGTSLQELGQSEEACLTLGEVENRYPSSSSVLDARAAMTRFGCN
jgi:tol-pal system protein YbgF